VSCADIDRQDSHVDAKPILSSSSNPIWKGKQSHS
jgi:hypothetical protein